METFNTFCLKIFYILLHQQTVTSKALMTLFVEVENIFNSRLLIRITVDSQSNEPLLSNHILQIVAMPNLSPGALWNHILYSKQRRNQVQFTADQFWSRWLREYLQTLQVRQKRTSRSPNL